MANKAIIGLEVHVELTTRTKMFCPCSAAHFSEPANTHTCPVCLGLPGALPSPNKKAIEDTILLGLALNCKVNPVSNFDRKQYFYPDLPKGYQISQYEHPFCINGYLTLDSGKKIRIERVHLEEDTAKLSHQGKESLIDFNRSGVPLVEIVSYPDMETAEEAKEYLKKIHEIIRSLAVSDADLDKGQMRLEPTINVQIGDKFTPLVEVKNINSFNFVALSINFEINRLTKEFGKTGVEKSPANKVTRGFDSIKKVTFPQRSKEEAKDYRYFPEPDIPPITVDENWFASIKSRLPELPSAKIANLVSLGVEEKYAKILYQNSDKLLKLKDQVDLPKLASLIANKKIDINGDLLSQYEKLTKVGETDTEKLTSIIQSVIANNPKIVGEYKSGKVAVLGFLICLAMKESKGSADPRTLSDLLKKSLL